MGRGYREIGGQRIMGETDVMMYEMPKQWWIKTSKNKWIISHSGIESFINDILK